MNWQASAALTVVILTINLFLTTKKSSKYSGSDYNCPER